MRQTSPDAVFLTWNDSRRSESLSARLVLKRVVYVSHSRGIFRHVVGTIETILFLARHRPTLIWYQFSYVLGITVAVYVHLAGKKRIRVAADLHTKALRREGPQILRPLILALKRWALASVRCTLVTNSADATYGEARLGITPVMLPDPLPDPLPNTPPQPGFVAEKRSCDVVFICSFAEDEPVDLMLEVCNQLFPRFSIAITGEARRLKAAVRKKLQSVAIVTDFLENSEYWKVLRHARTLVVLSSEPACLPCGAYEAIALGRKPILALGPEVRGFFRDLALYVRLEPDELRTAILKTVADATVCCDPSIALSYERLWERQWNQVSVTLAKLGCLPHA